jgi:serine/threonine protein kinase
VMGELLGGANAGMSEGAKDLIMKLVCMDPDQRLSAGEALDHPWMTS